MDELLQSELVGEAMFLGEMVMGIEAEGEEPGEEPGEDSKCIVRIGSVRGGSDMYRLLGSRVAVQSSRVTAEIGLVGCQVLGSSGK